MSNLKTVLGVAVSTTLKTALDLLFPAEDTVRKIESSGSGELSKNLPPSEPFAADMVPVLALFAYQYEDVKQLVWEIKYYRNEKITDTVGALMAEHILDKHEKKYKNRIADLVTDRPILLVPIPLTSRRFRERGFNHTELLARAVLKHLNKKFAAGDAKFSIETTLLKKIRHTPKQNSIKHREDRFKNIAGAFEVARSDIAKDAHIILIDDVVTTGATVGEASRVLLAAGAREVSVAAIAH